MLTAILVVAIICLIVSIAALVVSIILLSGFYDLYKRVRAVEDATVTKRDEDVSKHLQNVGRKGLK